VLFSLTGAALSYMRARTARSVWTGEAIYFFISGW
jgi:hypothetical protein